MSVREIRTERLLLRPFRPSDVDDVFAYASDPEWSANVPNVPYPYKRRHAEEFVARVVPARAKRARDISAPAFDVAAFLRGGLPICG